VYLSIGGVIKFIPSTGVTLPFISSGGSSIISTIIMFMVVQGIYQVSDSKK
jgi:cell division protein FtsW (lipid II flippase)